MTKPVRSFHDLPRWVWEMVAALERYEDEHDSPSLHPEECEFRPHLCACSIVKHVPDEVRTAAAIASQWREADEDRKAMVNKLATPKEDQS
jgi:hypothetical protein